MQSGGQGVRPPLSSTKADYSTPERRGLPRVVFAWWPQYVTESNRSTQYTLRILVWIAGRAQPENILAPMASHSGSFPNSCLRRNYSFRLCGD
jgi:hypothetical protein